MIVIKYGGHAMEDTDGLFSKAVQATIDLGQECVIVHGGGPQIGEALKKADIHSTFLGGYRVTSVAAFAVVQAVLSSDVLRNLVAHLRTTGLNATGLTGRDGGLLIAKRLRNLVDGTPAELGEVGEIVRVDPTILRVLLAGGYLPVISPIATEGDDVEENSSVGLNVNADLAAGAIAGALSADCLIFLTDVAGIYRNWPDASSLITKISAGELASMKDSFAEGMAPKVLATLNAINSGAKSVRIIDGKDPEAFAFALSGIGGTLVVA